MNIWSNMIRGVALGDAWGDPNEFRAIGELTRLNPQGPGLPKHLRITDDTQMTLYLAAALDDTWGRPEAEIKEAILEAFLEYRDDPDNNRAPGATVMGSLGALTRNNMNWQAATSHTSDGCGTVMRTSPTAFMPAESWVGVTAFAAAVTHGTANGIASAILNVAVLRDIMTGKTKPGELTQHALDLATNAKARGLTNIGTWLDGYMSPEKIEGGFDILITMLKQGVKLLPRLQTTPFALQSDPSMVSGYNDGPTRGGGWRAHSCLGAALLAVDMLPGKPYMALRRAVTTDGDSDSIGAVAGGLIGAAYPRAFVDLWDREFAEDDTLRSRFEPRYRRWIEVEADDYPFADPTEKGWLQKLVGLVR